MSENRATQDNLLKGLALCGVAIPIVFAVLVTVGGFIYEGYSHVTQAVSELSGVEAQHPWLQTTNFFVVGSLFVPFSLGLHRGIGAGRGQGSGRYWLPYPESRRASEAHSFPAIQVVNFNLLPGHCTT